VAEVIQASPGTWATGDTVEQQAGGAICETGGWVCSRRDWEDVRG